MTPTDVLEWKAWSVTGRNGVRWYVGRTFDGEDVAMFATFRREKDAVLVAAALNAYRRPA